MLMLMLVDSVSLFKFWNFLKQSRPSFVNIKDTLSFLETHT